MMAIAVAAMSFTACSNDLTEDVTPSQEFTVQINAVENLSRTHFGDLNENKYPTLWDATDKVKASLNMTTAKNSTETTIAVDGTTASFKLSLNESTAPYTIYAISPANVASSISSEYSNWTITIPDSQEPDATTCDPAAQVVVGQTEALDILPSSVDMKFEHLTAYAKINFTNVTPLGDAVVNSITITADQYIAGKHYYQVADNGSYTAGQLRSAGGAVKSITITTSELNNVWVALAPTTVSELTFTINTDQGPITKEVTGLNKVFESGVVATFNVDMAGKTIEKADKYTLVTDLSVLAEGDNVIIASADENYAISTDNSSTYRNATAITKDGDTIIPTATVGIFTVHDAGTNLYAFKEASDEKYLYASSSTSNYLQTQATNNANGYWDITINDAITGAAKVVAQGTNTRNVMQYNPNNGNPRFSCYAGTQKDVTLYYKSNGGAKIAIDPQIIASDINNVAAKGVTNATADIVVRGIASVNATPDGTVVTAASVSGNVLTYTVAANTGEAREGTITLDEGGSAETTITVSQLASEPEGVTTVKKETFSATSAAMDGVISYACYQGGGTSAPAINGGEIRLYQNSSGTGGGYITITAKEGYTISSVTIGSSMATKVAHTIGVSKDKSATSNLAANAKHTVSDVNDSSISIYCMGINKNTRLYVNYLSVSYKAAE